MSFQISFISLVSVRGYSYKRSSGVVCCTFMSVCMPKWGQVWSEDISCGKGLVIWISLGPGTVSWGPEVSLKVHPSMHWLLQPANHSKRPQHERWMPDGNDEYNASVGRTHRRDRVALGWFDKDEFRWDFHRWSWKWILDSCGFTVGSGRIGETDGGLVSRTLQRASASRLRIGGMLD